ncbi:MAG: hypothetical protein OXH99_08615 [Bryobacterales bacterium]|nr:hypothetical protein [Bryobacterales bacterium]
MPRTRLEIATEVDAELLASVRRIAKRESCSMDKLFEEALVDLIEKRGRLRPRQHVEAAYVQSFFRYGELYRLLAK